MGPIRRFDHVGITVDDLEAVKAFFVALGLEPDGESQIVEGEFVSTVVGIDDVRVEVVMLQAPGGGTKLELSTFLNPVERRAPQALQANEPGLRNICFEVEDLHAIVDRMRAKGFELVGGVADYEDAYRMCYVRGPEGIIVSLVQNIT
jgi:catechol 2,3-dioxygenase-like lactoylglutathione lyase family enzyme